MASLVIATHHEIAGAGIEALLRARGHHVIACCFGEDELLGASETRNPDIVVLAEDVVGLVPPQVARTVSQLRARNSSVGIIFLIEKRDAIRAADLLDLNVDGILLSSSPADCLVDCVQSVFHGRRWLDPSLLHHLATAERSSEVPSGLTSREAEIAHMVLRGLRNKEIASHLETSEGTVKMHLHHIYGKLRIAGRTQLALLIARESAFTVVSGDEAPTEIQPPASDLAPEANNLP